MCTNEKQGWPVLIGTTWEVDPATGRGEWMIHTGTLVWRPANWREMVAAGTAPAHWSLDDRDATPEEVASATAGR